MAVPADSTSASRRAFLGGVAAVSATVAAPVRSHDRPIDALWREHLRICAWQMEVDRLGKEIGRDDDEFFAESNDAFFANRDAIADLPYSPEALVANVLIASNLHGLVHDTLSSMLVESIVLEMLRPLISGPVAETVDDYLNNPDRPLAYGPLWGSVVEPGKTAIEMYLDYRASLAA